jgi:conjugative transfer signal peptidase TraF
MVVGVGLLALNTVVTRLDSAQDRVMLVYNPSDSAPRGWYRIGRINRVGKLHVGDLVLACLPADAAALAAQRGYLPAGIPLLKRIAAMAPQQVCSDGTTVSINGITVAVVRSTDGQGLALPRWQQCRPLLDGELFLLSNTHPASFDSRYFGPIAASDVIGRAHPIWTWDVRGDTP